MLMYRELGSTDRSLLLKRFVERKKERVGHAFTGNISAWAVTGDDGDGAVEDYQLLEDVADELVIVASGVVGAADGAGKEGVAAEKDFFVSFIVTYASDCVARGFDDLES